MTETDISKVLIEGDYATIMGVKYKRVEPPKPTTLWDVMRDELGFSIDMCDEIVDAVEKWLPKEHDTNSYKWNECLKLMREKLR
jgi:hypothetical protein